MCIYEKFKIVKMQLQKSVFNMRKYVKHLIEGIPYNIYY